MRIAVVGSGALGLYYGSLLQRSGNEVHFLLRRDYESIMARGLSVYSLNGDFHLAHINGYRSTHEIREVDLVLICLKTFANEHFQALVTPLVGKNTRILTLQNGLGNEELLAELFGPEKIFGGVAFICAYRGNPGTVHHVSEGKINLGPLQSEQNLGVEIIKDLFTGAGINCRVVSDLKKARWEKLVWNIPFNGTCALLQQPVNAVLAHKGSRDLISAMMSEIITAANAQQLTEKIPFSLAENMVVSSEKLGSYQPSMLIDRIEGRPLELDAIFRVPLTEAYKHGIPMLRVQTLFALLQAAVAG
jgi:2-dehydropantoate 2-reductase